MRPCKGVESTTAEENGPKKAGKEGKRKCHKNSTFLVRRKEMSKKGLAVGIEGGEKI